MGDCTDDILKTTDVSEETVEYDDLKQVFETHFGDRKNVVVERAKFHKRVQKTWRTNF